jgi:hypothetical protein
VETAQQLAPFSFRVVQFKLDILMLLKSGMALSALMTLASEFTKPFSLV